MISNKKIILNGCLNDYRSRHKQMRNFAYKENRRSRDILSIAFSIFQLEKILREEKISNIKIGRFLNTNSIELKSLISELISFVLLENVNIDFFNSDKRFYSKKFEEVSEKDVDALVLFSGGIDSYAGIHWAKNKFNKISGLFCAHSDQAWSIHTVNELSKNILSNQDIKLNTINVPKIEKGGYSQLRGFLYILSAGAWLELLNIDTIVLSECGPTMYQPRFGQFDNVTMTTHPVVVEIALKILELLLGRKINIYMPFEDMTKAEVISYLSDEISIANTHSCISQRFGTHDGTCYGCIIRRLGSIATNRKDVAYSRNPLIENNANKDNLLSLLLFSQDILLSPKTMPLYQIENIESYEKYNLFKRFALDNLAAIHLLNSHGIKLTKEVKVIYEDYITQNTIKDLNQRLEDLKNRNYKINENFSNFSNR